MGVWLACFALACQLVLTFGHVHSAGAAAYAPWAVAAGAARDASLSMPSGQRDPAGVEREFCAVCGNIGRANVPMLPTAPHPVPPIAIAAEAWLTGTLGLTASLSFQGPSSPFAQSGDLIACTAGIPQTAPFGSSGKALMRGGVVAITLAGFAHARTVATILTQGQSDEGDDPVHHGPRHHFSRQCRSELWHELARSKMRVSGAVLSPGVAVPGNRPDGSGLFRVEDVGAPAKEEEVGGDRLSRVRQLRNGRRSATSGMGDGARLRNQKGEIQTRHRNHRQLRLLPPELMARLDRQRLINVSSGW